MIIINENNEDFMKFHMMELNVTSDFFIENNN